MSLSQLEVINEMLASLGELPVNEIDVDHDLIASGVRKLSITNKREQGKGWWFNTEHLTLQPDAESGEIYLPSDTINVTPRSPHQLLVQRGRRLFDPRREDGFTINKPVAVKLVRAIPFDDLPDLARAFIGYSAIADFQVDYDADQFKYQQILAKRSDAKRDLGAEDIRNRKVNLLKNNHTAQDMWAAGVRRYRSPQALM